MKLRSTLMALAIVLSCSLTANLVSAQETEPTKKTRKKKATNADTAATPAPAATAAPAATPAPAAQAAPAKTAAPAPPAPPAKTATSKSEPANSAGVSAADISRAQGGGMVWVNTESGVYHKSGRYYGKTKQGKFMSEADAKKANYRDSKQEIGEKK